MSLVNPQLTQQAQRIKSKPVPSAWEMHFPFIADNLESFEYDPPQYFHGWRVR